MPLPYASSQPPNLSTRPLARRPYVLWSAWPFVVDAASISTVAGVPKDVVEKLAAEIRAVMSEDDVKKLLSDEGAIPQLSPSPDEFKKFVDSEIVRWGELVKLAGAKIE